MAEPLLTALFFAVALVYASVGFGGGSTYLALLTLASIPLPQVAPVALVCNLIVVAGGSWQFVRAGHFLARLIGPFLVTSLPAAYLGGRFRLEVEALEMVTALALAAAAAAMLVRDAWPRAAEAQAPRDVAAGRLWIVGGLLGGVLGGLAGLIGIGGGIFLAPALHLMRWGTAKQVATVASLFILANSLAGLAGQMSRVEDPSFLLAHGPLFVAVLVGGQIGSRLGAWRLRPAVVRRVTAVVVLVAAARMLMSG